jgi:hypothetical protein
MGFNNEFACPTIIALTMSEIHTGELQSSNSEVKTSGKECRSKYETADLDNEIHVECHIVRRTNSADVTDDLALSQ